jgi:class 3 adenylate cyclase
MGFGLHAGWAIEGAVGSLQKVDATYLSPHVNMAARLETSSKQYGVPLLASQVGSESTALYFILCCCAI